MNSRNRELRRQTGALPMGGIGGEVLAKQADVWLAKDVPELLPVLRIRNPKLRLLQMVCPSNHLIITVYRTAVGPVGVFHRITWAETEANVNRDRQEVRWSHHRYDFAVVVDEEDVESAFLAECKCGPQVVRLRQLASALAAGQRRVVLNLSHPRL